MSPASPNLASKYQLGERIGGGGMAEVFRAQVIGAAGFSRPVAIKRIKRSISTDKGFAELFANEARLVARLMHPNIVQTIDFDRDETGCFYLVMEMIEGVDLRQFAARGRLPVSAIVYIIGEVLRALDYAHEMVDADGTPLTIVHRDISPHNIMVSFQGGIKVVDFGIAKAIENSVISKSGTLRGKVAYMSPEQVHGEALDGRSDLFAVGIMMHELLTGKRLFLAESDAATLSNLLYSPIPTPRSLNDQVPPDIDAVVMKLLARDRDERFLRSRDALEALLSSSVSSGKGRLDLETVIGERFADEVPRRVQRLSTAPAPASVRSSSSDMHLGDTVPLRSSTPSPSAPAAISPAALARTAVDSPEAMPRRTMTAPTQASEEPSDPTAESFTTREVLQATQRARWPIAAAVLGLAALGAIAFFVLGGEADDSQAADVLALAPAHDAATDQGLVDSHAPRAHAQDAGTASPAGSEEFAVDAGVVSDSGDESEQEDTPKVTKTGRLRLRVYPWATIVVDGKSYGQTPQTLKLRAGTHRVVLENSSIGKVEKLSIKVKADDTTRLERDWR